MKRFNRILQATSRCLGFLLVFVVLGIRVEAREDTIKLRVAEEKEKVAVVMPSALENPDINLEELKLRLVPLTVKELQALAESWQDLTREATQKVVDKSLQIRDAEPAAAEKLRQERLQLIDQQVEIFDKFSAVVLSMERKGGPAEEVAALRGYLQGVKAQGTSQLTFQEFADSFLKWLKSPEGGVGVGLRILIIVASFFALLLVAKIIRSWAARLFRRIPNLSKLLHGFLVMMVYWLTLAFGIMIVLAALGIDITPLFALVGGASFIIAFALQETLSNLASGLMIMINRPFDEGDFVKIAGLGGKVVHVSVVSTTVTTPDNQIIVIPNSKVWGDVITNVTASDVRRVDLVFGISYNDSIDQAQQILEEVVAKHPLVLSDPEPVIQVHELADSSVNFVVRPWVATENYWETYWDFQRTVKQAFDENGISIPFPQRDIHVHLTEEEEPQRITPANRRQ